MFFTIQRMIPFFASCVIFPILSTIEYGYCMRKDGNVYQQLQKRSRLSRNRPDMGGLADSRRGSECCSAIARFVDLDWRHNDTIIPC